MPTNRSPWSLNRVLALVLLAGFLTLLIDLRAEHVDVVRETWLATIPLFYSGFMVLLLAFALLQWTPLVRRVLFWIFSLSFIVGALGVWFHNHGDLLAPLHTLIAVWYDKTLEHAHGPPPIAPLAFCGLGLLGMLATAKHFQPQETLTNAPTFPG